MGQFVERKRCRGTARSVCFHSRSPHTKLTYRKSLLLASTLSPPSTALLHHPLPYYKGASPLTPTPRLSLPPRAIKQTYQVAFCSPACLRPTPEEPISRHKHISLFPQDAFASACCRHVRRGPGLPLQPAFSCVQASPARACQEQGL